MRMEMHDPLDDVEVDAIAIAKERYATDKDDTNRPAAGPATNQKAEGREGGMGSIVLTEEGKEWLKRTKGGDSG